ncbi:hypothetical protein Tcan_00137 [Toxocara canis]|uniref:Uncharacterized protein n=1 Tax=Toxocara canis TaxID=6265 RepID=A0A0B2VLQ5_TOXCA|nr:hypothetical protein Tcan_00137 [Toxocara canis]
MPLYSQCPSTPHHSPSPSPPLHGTPWNAWFAQNITKSSCNSVVTHTVCENPVLPQNIGRFNKRIITTLINNNWDHSRSTSSYAFSTLQHTAFIGTFVFASVKLKKRTACINLMHAFLFSSMQLRMVCFHQLLNKLNGIIT